LQCILFIFIFMYVSTYLYFIYKIENNNNIIIIIIIIYTSSIMSSSSDDDDSDLDSIGSVRSRPESRVTLAKIFMSTPNHANPQRPLIAEWDGKDPGHTKQLFVYDAYIRNTTYQSYVTLSSQSENQGNNLRYSEIMRLSYIHDPLLHSIYPELATLLPNLMSGTLSFVNRRELRERHRIYVFDPDRTPGIQFKGHFDVVKPMYTYWYKLNNLYGQDYVMEGPPDYEKIREIPQDEFELNYKIFSNFRPDNADMFLLERESRPRMKFLKAKRPSRNTTHIHTAGGKKRNKTRRKYRKIKSRRSRVMR
jgi:hypothetical protein